VSELNEMVIEQEEHNQAKQLKLTQFRSLSLGGTAHERAREGDDVCHTIGIPLVAVQFTEANESRFLILE
jgi:hypothetical protein